MIAMILYEITICMAGAFICVRVLVRFWVISRTIDAHESDHYDYESKYLK